MALICLRNSIYLSDRAISGSLIGNENGIIRQSGAKPGQAGIVTEFYLNE